MVLILDGSSEQVAHVCGKSGIIRESILMYTIDFNRITIFTRTHRILSYHLIQVPYWLNKADCLLQSYVAENPIKYAIFRSICNNFLVAGNNVFFTAEFTVMHGCISLYMWLNHSVIYIYIVSQVGGALVECRSELKAEWR